MPTYLVEPLEGAKDHDVIGVYENKCMGEFEPFNIVGIDAYHAIKPYMDEWASEDCEFDFETDTVWYFSVPLAIVTEV